MRKHEREILGKVRKICKAHGLSVSIRRGSRGHALLVIQGAGVERKSPLSCSPRSAGTACRLKIEDVKRICREISAVHRSERLRA